MSEEAMMIISGDPEALNYLLSKIMEIADLADEGGMPEVGDRLSSLLPAVSMMKAAQYEGFQNYWIANGRAFESVFKEHVENDPDGSFQEAWAKTLESFMESLLGDQLDFAKQIKKAQYEGFQNHWIANSRAFELSFKQKVENQPEGEKSFEKAWLETLEEYEPMLEREEFAEEKLKTASREDLFLALTVGAAKTDKMSLSQKYEEWKGAHRECMRHLARRINSNIENGSSPGPAVYEAIDYFASGRHALDVERILRKQARLLSQAGIGNWLSRQIHKGNPARVALLEVENQAGKAEGLVDKWEARAKKGAFDPRVLQEDFAPILESINRFYDIVEVDPRSGGSSQKVPVHLPPVPWPVTLGTANPKYVEAQAGGTPLMTAQTFQTWAQDLSRTLDALEGAAGDYGKFQHSDEMHQSLQMGVDPQSLPRIQQIIQSSLKRMSWMIRFNTSIQVDPEVPQNLENTVMNAMKQYGTDPLSAAEAIWESATESFEQKMGQAAQQLQANNNQKAIQQLSNAFMTTSQEAVQRIAQALSAQNAAPQGTV